MEFIEADPLPVSCRQCVEKYCDECEHMGERWILTPEDQRRLSYKAKERAAARLQLELERMRE